MPKPLNGSEENLTCKGRFVKNNSNHNACCLLFPLKAVSMATPVNCFVSMWLRNSPSATHRYDDRAGSSSGILLNQFECFKISRVDVMSYRSHTAAPSRVFDHLYDPVFTTSDQKNVYKENCIALTRSAPIHVYPVYRSMFSELNYEQRNCYAYQKNLLPSIAFSRPSPTSERCQVTGVDRAKFFSNPMGNIRTINVGLMADDGAERVAEAQVIKYRSTSIQTTYRFATPVDRHLIKFLVNSKYLFKQTPGNPLHKQGLGYQK